MNTPLAKEAYNNCVNKLIAMSKGIVFEVEEADERDAYIKAALKTGEQELINFTTQIKVRG